MQKFIDSLCHHAEIMEAAREVTLLPENQYSASNRSICFFYHRTKRYNVTIAYQRRGDNSVVYGAAFCRPGDQFIKRRGRDIALGRMDAYDRSVLNPGGTRWEVHESILNRLTQYDSPPYVPGNFRP
tara:strand:+ start:15260 stop:15640 length:381 start_codon:yes stop_codon:yes gene_type:complete